MDFFTSYMVCLEDCLNAQLQQIRLDVQTAHRRVSDLQTEIERLNHKLDRMDNALPRGKP